jgi:hypothetical protein
VAAATPASRPPTNAGPPTSTAASAAAAQVKPGGKTVVDQTAQVVVFGWHRFVDKVRRPDTEITPQDFEKQMQMLKDRGITARMRTRGESKEIFLTDPDNIQVQLTDVTFCGGSGPRGNVSMYRCMRMTALPS